MVHAEYFTATEDARKVSFDSDVAITQVSASNLAAVAGVEAGSLLLSFNPSSRFSWLSAPPTDGFDQNTISIGAKMNGSVEVRAGNEIFLSVGSSGIYLIFFDLIAE